MKVFFVSGKNQENQQIIEEKDTDAIDIITTKYFISIRISGILIKDRENKTTIDLEQDGVIFDSAINLT